MLTRDLPVAVTIMRPDQRSTSEILVSELLDHPTSITGIYDEGAAAIVPGDPEPHMFGISFPWLGKLAGASFDEINSMAATLAAHAAAMNPLWPGRHAHVRSFPAVDFGPLLFKVTPQYVAPGDAGLQARLRAMADGMPGGTKALMLKMAADAAACAAGTCDCAP